MHVNSSKNERISVRRGKEQIFAFLIVVGIMICMNQLTITQQVGVVLGIEAKKAGKQRNESSQ